MTFESQVVRNSNAVIARNIWRLAIVLGTLYMLSALARSGAAFTPLADLPKWLVVSWKGAFSACLALSVFAARNGRPSHLIAAALAVSAVADMLLVTVGLAVSGMAFAAAHCFAIVAYARERDRDVSVRRLVMAAMVPVTAVALSVFAVRYGGLNIGIGFFPIISGTMAAFAIVSRFPLLLNGLGATIFVASDVLVFVDIGVLQNSGTFGWLTWACYAGGYILVARGAIDYQNSSERSG